MVSAVLHTDGGSRGNPGIAGCGFSLEVEGGATYLGGWYLGECTNNYAEYSGLLWGMRNALALGVEQLHAFADSELMVRQLNGEYKVKSADLKPLHAQAMALASQLSSFTVEHVYREANKEADRMANEAMDAQGAVGSFVVDMEGGEAQAQTPSLFEGSEVNGSGASEQASALPIITREVQDERASRALSELAAFASKTEGRMASSDLDYLRNEFQRDRDKILHTKAFRRLSHKTQVFLAPEGDHYRTRLTHTLEVAQIARTIARALALNEDLTEAIALGHDLGHTPFGHAGEEALCHALAKHKGINPESEQAATLYRHNEQSLRVVDVIENGGKGLNLTAEVRDGIVCHTGGRRAETLEGRIVATADRIAYVNHDIDDAIRAGLLGEDDLPTLARKVLGVNHSSRIQTLVHDMVSTSAREGDILLSEPVWDAMQELRAFLFKNVYRSAQVVEQTSKAKQLIGEIFERLVAEPQLIPEELRTLSEGDTLLAACDYIAGMTDRFACRFLQ